MCLRHCTMCSVVQTWAVTCTRSAFARRRPAMRHLLAKPHSPGGKLRGRDRLMSATEDLHFGCGAA